jgi:hypothetical protein
VSSASGCGCENRRRQAERQAGAQTKSRTALGWARAAPRVLREYYGIAGRLDLNRAHNQLYTPHKWFVDAGKFVFMEENQEVVYWGIPISAEVGDDPPVSQGVNVVDQPIDWHPEHGACSEFLLVMLHWQAVCGGMRFTGSADISPKALILIRATWSLVGEGR